MADILDDASADRMVANVQKSVVLTFPILKSNPEFYPPLPPSSHVTELKLLGVYPPADFKWEKQMEMMLQRANAGISSLKLLSRHGIPSDYLLRVYTSFIRSCLEYSSPVWHYGLTQEQWPEIGCELDLQLLVVDSNELSQIPQPPSTESMR